MHPRPDGFVARACAALLDRIDEVVLEVAAAIESTEPVYGARDLVSTAELHQNNRTNLVAILSYLTGSADAPTAAPHETGRRRAEQGVPLPPVLRAYRIGTRVVWDALLAAAGSDLEANRELLSMASQVWQLVDDYSQALTAGYQEAVAERDRRDARAHDAAFDALLAGQVDGPRLWDCARTLRLPQQGSYVVVVAADAEVVPGVAEALAVLGVSSAWRVRLDNQIGVVALTPRFTPERLATSLRERRCGRIGVSSPFSALTEAPAALRQAEITCAAAIPGEVLHHDQALVPVLLASAPEVAAALRAAVLGAVLALPEHDRAVLLTTVQAWFDHDGEIAAVAAALYCHRNTVRFRLNRVAELTGRRLSAPVAAAQVHLALQAHRILAGATERRE
ncbi:PucR family transcriptional regulator [Nocardia brasiliensis]|uniref:PucR family transcriptional regulator n=1 Tax=Nocardia brasiliensis TaxID=37326 RepID=UPI0024557DDB|nr:helix-turn-helix domain-containing protein [Nocardia brasiliensis]